MFIRFSLKNLIINTFLSNPLTIKVKNFTPYNIINKANFLFFKENITLFYHELGLWLYLTLLIIETYDWSLNLKNILQLPPTIYFVLNYDEISIE